MRSFVSSARLAGALSLVVWLTACANAPELDHSVTETLPQRQLLEDVPFHPQRDYQCGPATLAMVLNHAGVDVGVDQLIPEIYVPSRKGSFQPEMLAASRRHGRIPFTLEPRFAALLEEVDAGHAVVVLQNLSLPAFPLWHFAVVNGYDLESEEVLLRTGVTRQDATGFGRFDATWQRSERWAFVALTPGELPVTIAPDAAIQATSDFERVQGPEQSLPAWQALVDRFPEEAMGHFALANAYHAAGQPQAAIDAWRSAVAREPSLAPAWLNLGLTLASQGDDEEAREALRRAASLDGPWQQGARQALNEQQGGHR